MIKRVKLQFTVEMCLLQAPLTRAYPSTRAVCVDKSFPDNTNKEHGRQLSDWEETANTLESTILDTDRIDRSKVILCSKNEKQYMVGN